jgi:hypothetical protein
VGAFLDYDPASGRTKVTPTFTCCHCQAIRPKRDELGKPLPFAMCHQCWAPVCEACHADGRCRPWEKRCEEFEARVNRQLARGAMFRGLGIE